MSIMPVYNTQAGDLMTHLQQTQQKAQLTLEHPAISKAHPYQSTVAASALGTL